MKDLPSLYARVVANRPDLAVFCNDRTLYHFPALDGWGLQHPRTRTIAALSDYCDFDEAFASALILAWWVEWLPEGFCITKTKMSDGGIAWIVAKDMDDSFAQFCADTHIEALAAFYLGETT